MTWKSRYSVLLILSCAYLLCYMDRMVMASAIPFIAKEFALSPVAMGAVLSAFFMGYSVMQIPGGLLADRLGPNRVMTASIVCWSLFTALTGAAGSLASILVVRIFFGLSEGPFPPSAAKTIAGWFPQGEVGRANGIQLAAVNIGAVVAPLLVSSVIATWGWRSVFYSLWSPGLLLALVVWKVAKDSPEPIEQDDQRAEKAVTPKIRLSQLLKMPAVLWCALTLFLWSIAGWGLLNWLPTYLLQARGFSIVKMGVFASLPYLAGAIGYYLGGHIADKYFSRRRQVPILAGLILGGGTTYVAAIAPTGEWAVAALMLAFLFLFISSAGIFTLPLVIVPSEAVGVAFGLVNTVGQIAAFLSPLAVGYVLSVTHSNFTWVLYGFVGLFVAAACAATQLRQPISEKDWEIE